MHLPRRFHRLAVSVVAGTSLFLGVSAISANRTELAPLPEQQVASADALDLVAEPVLTTTTTAVAVTAAASTPELKPLVLPDRPEKWFSPAGRNGGTEGLARFLAAIALHNNSPLYVSEQWGRTTGGANSDHHVSRSDSWAADLAVRGIQAPTPATELAAKRVAAALGEPDWQGGDLQKTINGYRFQVLWKVAGHFNHVHVGVRKI
jgi:hypothetical protein